MASNLLVIGNGFDLACKLNTKYAHYFDNVLKQSSEMKALVDFLDGIKIDDLEDKSIDKQLLKMLPQDSDVVTFWDVYFTFQDWMFNRLHTDQTWMDIEDMLLRCFEDKNSYDISCRLALSALESIADNSLEALFPPGSIYRYLGSYVYRVFKKRSYKITEDVFKDYLEKELDRFSCNFSKYIKQQLLEHKDYTERAVDLVSKIIGKNRMNDYMIDSFNYTPIDYAIYHHNIHGVASNGDVVFGITCGNGADREKIHKEWKYKFTKEYKIARIMAKNGSSFNSYLDVKKVFIFGSSLGEQDFDYFEAIFDECKIVDREPKANIIFVYSIYDKTRSKEIVDDITTKVTRLINMYGDRNNRYGLFRQLMQKRVIFIKQIDTDN